MSLVRLIAGTVLVSLVMHGQEFRSTISGRVTDPQAALVPGVKVIAVQKETGAKSGTVSGEDGSFVLPFLAPGSYRISAEASGFKRYLREDFSVSTNERLALNIVLEIGEVAETVTVTDVTPLVMTSTASTGQVITARQIENIPMAGRTPLVLAHLAFGVIPTSDPRVHRPFDNQGPSDMAMGGAPNRGNELLLDGAPNTTGNNRVAYNPPVDAVAEVKVESFQADAAYGHTGGGTVNVVMRGGTNEFHGSLYEFNQTSALFATPFFTNRAGLEKPVTRYNQYGGSIGGPVVIPRLFNGRNKLFFFFVYEGIRDSIADPLISTVPTAAQRGGDFSQLLALGPNYQIYDPATGVREGGRVRRQPFPGNIIPPNRISPVARNYLAFFPDPNLAGRPDGGDNYLSNNNGEVNRFSSYLGRLDLNLSAKHKMFVNVRQNDRYALRGNPIGRALDDITAFNATVRTNWGATLDDVYTISPTLVLNTRVNFTRFEEPRPNLSRGYDFTQLGFPASLRQASTLSIFPRIGFDRYTAVGDSGGVELPWDYFQIFTSATKIAGSHTLKFGADLRWGRESGINYGFSSGTYNFSTNWTRGPLDNSPSSPIGQDLASFLLGLPTSGSFDVNYHRTNQAGYYAFFIQDDWRASSNLTLNLGLRLDRDMPTTERFNRTVNGFDYENPGPVAVAASAAYDRNPIPEIAAGRFRAPGGLLFASEANRNVFRSPDHYLSPRIGMAWNPAFLGGNTVIRAGAGVFIFALGTTGINQIGFSQTTPLTPTLDGFLTPAATLSDPFPFGVQQPTGASFGLGTFLGRNVQFFNPDALNPYSVRWNFDIQRGIGQNTVFQIGYQGNSARQLGVDRQINFVPAEYLSTSGSRDNAAINRLTSIVSNPFAGLIPGTPLNGGQIARQQLLRPFPQFTGVTAQQLNDGSSTFHMLQARLERRFSNGLSLLANYLYAKLLEKRSWLNDADADLEKRIAGEDRPQRIVISGTYDLPFGRGKALAGSAGPWLNRLVGGWIVNGIYTWNPGAPVNWGNVIYYGGDLQWDPRNIDRVFDTSRFNTRSTEQLDWNLRTFSSRFANLREDSVNNLDASVIKDVPIKERFKAQFRFETFNTLNRAAFAAPNTQPLSSAFGTSRSQRNLPRRVQMAIRLVW
jgi:hypothetical protein